MTEKTYEARRSCPFCQGDGKELVMVQATVVVFSSDKVGYAGSCGHFWGLGDYRGIV